MMAKKKKPATVKRLIGFSHEMNRVLNRMTRKCPIGPEIERLLRDHPEVQQIAGKMRVNLPDRLSDSRGKRGQLVEKS